MARRPRPDTLIGLASDRIVPGHDPEPFEKFPAQGRVATIKSPS